jgi:hypothetical protein
LISDRPAKTRQVIEPGWFWVFVNERLSVYTVHSDAELGAADSIRWDLLEEGFDVLWDSARSRREAVRYMEQFYPQYTRFETIPTPITFREACEFINKHHRHHLAPQGMKFALGISNGEKLVGVLTAGRPVSRHMDDGYVLEVTRLCVLRSYIHSCSKLYASARRIAREMGYRALVTYTLEDEPGASLRAAGFRLHKISCGGSWNTAKRPRVDKHPTGRKKVWVLPISGA